MNKFSFLFSGLVLTTLFFTNCTSYKYTSRLARISTDNTYMTPNVVDVKIDFTKKITARSGKHPLPASAKEEAYFKAINENNIDVLVSPIYELETTSKFLFFGGNSKASVIGYAGYFINPRTLPEEQNKNYTVKLAALEKMLKIELLVKEEQKTVILATPSCADNNGKGIAEKEILFKSPSLIEKFNDLYYGGNSSYNIQQGNSTTEYNEDGSEPKKSFLSKVPILGMFFKK